MSDGAEIARVITTRAETQQNYDRIARYYELVEGYWERKARNAGLATLRAEPGESVLEIGCGPGYSLVELAAGVGSRGRVVGLDLSSTMCRLARRRLGGAGHGAVVQGDAARLPFRSSCFDAAFLSFTLELFDTPEIPRVLAECLRILRPKGRLGLVSLSKEGEASRMRRLYEWGHERFPHLLDCRPIYAGEALIDAGFNIGAEQTISLWGLPVAVLVARAPTG